MRKTSGFTMVELIVTMTLVGIMAIVILPRFMALDSFDAAGYADQSAALLRYGQKTAIAQRRWVAVNLADPPTLCSQTSFPLCAADCVGGANIASIAFPGGEARAPRSSTTLSGPSVLCFNAVGRPILVGESAVATASAEVKIMENASVFRTITIEAETGYVH